jgi:hypothetical protein
MWMLTRAYQIIRQAVVENAIHYGIESCETG